MNNKLKQAVAILLVLITLITSSCTMQSEVKTTPAPITTAASELSVHFIDVGQGDSTLIQLPDNKVALIDGGNRADAVAITNYLKKNKIEIIDYLIATHPHEDHIGALPAIIEDFQINSIYMPKAAASTKIFEELLTAIKEKGYKISTAAAGANIIDTEEMKLGFVAPNSSDYDELNNYSAVLKLTYKNTSFLFTGDAEDVSEKEILKKSFNVQADVLKVGHHGGRTSSTQDFLNRIAPQYAVISVGKDNDYRHPHEETLDRLNQQRTKIFRTDQQGTIVASSDGKSISFDTQPIQSNAASSVVSSIYVGNRNSKVFHLPSCSALPKLENQVELKTKQEAVSEGYKPCSICKP